MKEEPGCELPVTHDSMRLIEAAKTICEQRIYLDEAKELYSLISSKWLHVRTFYNLNVPWTFLNVAITLERIFNHLFKYHTERAANLKFNWMLSLL